MPTDSAERYESLLLTLGMCLGALSDETVAARLADSLRNNTLNPAYIQRLRDRLTAVLVEAGVEDAER